MITIGMYNDYSWCHSQKLSLPSSRLVQQRVDHRKHTQFLSCVVVNGTACMQYTEHLLEECDGGYCGGCVGVETLSQSTRSFSASVRASSAKTIWKVL